jgi:molecular chaperone GrpE
MTEKLNTENLDHTESPEEDPASTTPPDSGETARLIEQSEEARRSAEQFKDQLLRKAAEFENYKRRTEADIALIVRNAGERLLKAILPILDDLDRSLKAGRDQPDYDSFYRGIELVAAKLSKTLHMEGLRPFESVGRAFDVAYHDALLQVPRDDVPPHTVVEEVDRGYMLHDRVVRHAKVIVSTEPGGAPEQGSESDA